MSDKDFPAFPLTYQGDTRSDCYGLTLRDYFAAKVIPAMVAHYSDRRMTLCHNEMAKEAYAIADAMLEARE